MAKDDFYLESVSKELQMLRAEIDHVRAFARQMENERDGACGAHLQLRLDVEALKKQHETAMNLLQKVFEEYAPCWGANDRARVRIFLKGE